MKTFLAALMSLAFIGTSHALTPSGPVTVTTPGEVVSGLHITSDGETALTVLVPATISNLKIDHRGAHGISCRGASGVVIENVEITHTGVPLTFEESNIHVENCPGIQISYARLKRGSSGVWMVNSPYAELRFIEGYDHRGPFPRGQLVQFDKSPNCLLEDFSARNGSESWAEDNVSAYYSDNCVIRNGHIDGNNSPSGVGVMFEHSDWGLVEDVDTVRMGNGSFSAYPSNNVTFRRTRARDNICTDQGRGLPKSKALVWAGQPGSYGLRLEDSRYFNLCNPGNIVWDGSTFDIQERTSEDFVLRAPFENVFAWDNTEPPPPTEPPEPMPIPDPAYMLRSEFIDWCNSQRVRRMTCPQ